jgi:hypothetical protein
MWCIPAQVIYEQSFFKGFLFLLEFSKRQPTSAFFKTLPTIIFAGACPQTKLKDLLKSQFGSSRDAGQYDWYGRGNVRKKSGGIAS